MTRHIYRVLGLVAMLIHMVVPTTSHAVQSNMHDVNIWTVTSDFGEPVYDVCYQLFLNGVYEFSTYVPWKDCRKSSGVT